MYERSLCEAIHLYATNNTKCGLGSSGGIATDYVLDCPGSNPGRDEIFPPVQTGPGAHPASCKMGTGSFPGVKCGRGVLLITHPLLVPRSSKSRAVPLTYPLGHTGSVTDHFTFNSTKCPPDACLITFPFFNCPHFGLPIASQELLLWFLFYDI